jgi:CubicO group peptidase (beta-lactamase class C family)
MLALVIEKVTNLSYQDAMKRLFKPLGMTNTYVFDYEKDKSTLSHLIENFSMVELGLLRCDIRR